jgi:hypothetical protein
MKKNNNIKCECSCEITVPEGKLGSYCEFWGHAVGQHLR